ncbi:MAG: hypothetical protein IK020_05415 [Clostridiales bacterium]|nr:hypothetical protein [Clostridiales bacterium]
MNPEFTIRPGHRYLTLENAYHLCVALLPFLYIFQMPVLGMSVGTIIILALVPYSFLFFVKGMDRFRGGALFLFLFFYIYLIMRSDMNIVRILLCVATFINIGGMIHGAVKTSKLRKIIETFAIINLVLLIIQILFFYVLKIRLQYVPRGLVYAEYRESYVFRPLEGLFRPSALFLEPSHFAQYCIYALISALFPREGKPKLKKAAAIAAGCVLTTSGMGIALTAGVIGWFLLFSKEAHEKKILRIFAIIPLGLLGLLALSQTTFFATAMQRIFSNVDGYNAVSGRTHNWNDAIGTMDTYTLWTGYGDSVNFPLYLAGLADTIYKYGIICVVLEFFLFLYLCLKSRKNYVILGSVCFAFLFVIAHMTNFITQTFYFGILIAETFDMAKPATSGILPADKEEIAA